jgi:hypothetical protein
MCAYHSFSKVADASCRYLCGVYGDKEQGDGRSNHKITGLFVRNQLFGISRLSLLSLSTIKHMASKACTHLRRVGRHVQQIDAQIRCFSSCTARCITRSTVQTRNIASTSRPSFRPNPTGICSARRREYHYYTEVEQDHDRIIQTSIGKVEEFEKASKAVRCPLLWDYQN